MVLPFFSASCSSPSWRWTRLPRDVCRQLGRCSGCRWEQMHCAAQRVEGLANQFPGCFSIKNNDFKEVSMDFSLSLVSAKSSLYKQSDWLPQKSLLLTCLRCFICPRRFPYSSPCRLTGLWHIMILPVHLLLPALSKRCDDKI